MTKSIIAAALVAIGTVALRDPNSGERVHVPDGQPLPDWVTEKTRGELIELGAAQPASPTVGDLAADLLGQPADPEALAEHRRAAAESVVQPGGSVAEILGGDAPRAAGDSIEQSAGGASSAGTHTEAEAADAAAPAASKVRGKKATA